MQPKSETAADDNGDSSTNGRFEVEKVKPKDQQFSTYRGVRSMKHTKENKHYQEGLRKSSSLHDLSTEERESGTLDNSRFLSRSGDRLDADAERYSDSARLLAGYGNNPYVTIPRTQSWKSPIPGQSLAASKNQTSASNSSIVSNQSTTSEKSTASTRRGSFDGKTSQGKTRNAGERAKLHRERSASMKSLPPNFSLPKIASSIGSTSVDRLVPRGESAGHENETDEHKVRELFKVIS